MALIYKAVYTYEEINGKYSCTLEKYLHTLRMQARDYCAVAPLSKRRKFLYIQKPATEIYALSNVPSKLRGCAAAQ
jgi:hypothetical protein